MSPADCFRAGYRLERARSPSAYAAALRRVRALLRESPTPDETRYFIETGRREARQIKGSS